MKADQISLHILIFFSTLLSCLPPANAQNRSFGIERATTKKGSPEKCETVASSYLTCRLVSKKTETFCRKEFVKKWKNGKHTDGYDCRKLFHSKGIVFLAKVCVTAKLDISECSDMNKVLFKSVTSPEIKFCTLDVRICPDGSAVNRDPANNCQFDPCCCDPEEKPMCTDGSRCCADGTWSCGIGNGQFPCDVENSIEPSYDGPFGEVCEPGGLACTDDAKICPDGSGVGRDPENNCEFFPCPSPKCDSVDDCVLYSNYCAECLCEALHVKDPQTICPNPSPCFADPCMGKKVKCYMGKCVLE